MADRHPYSPTPSGIAAAINQFRKSFPEVVNADTLRKLAIAPKNESYAINTLRFIGVIDKDGKKTERAENIFYQTDSEFEKGFKDLVESAYVDLFKLHKEAAWSLPKEKLVAFFRSTDKTTALVGGLQATTFQLLATFAGKNVAPASGPAPPLDASPKPKPARAKPERRPRTVNQVPGQTENAPDREIGLTVRIEVNLPAASDQETYDRIFRSIRENLLNVPKA